MKIPKTTLNNILEVYKPNCRYLKDCEMNFPRAKGIFSIPKSAYVESTGHFNAAELIICYNQLAYSFFAESSKQGLIKEVGIIPLNKFKENQLKNYFIVEMDRIKFRKLINPENFEGEIELKGIRKLRDILYLKTEYNFGNGSATGKINLASLTHIK